MEESTGEKGRVREKGKRSGAGTALAWPIRTRPPNSKDWKSSEHLLSPIILESRYLSTRWA